MPHMKPIPELHELVAPIRGLGEKETRRIAVEMGIPAGTLYRLVLGYADGCHYNTALRISRWLAENPAVTRKARRAQARPVAEPL